MLRRLLSKRTQFPSAPTFPKAVVICVTRGRSSKENPSPTGLQGTLSNKLATSRRVIKHTLLGCIALGLTVVGSLELAHQYMEFGAMRPEVDEEIKKFQWDVSGELWQGHPSVGGTDPGLGRTGRHAVRSAWYALHWSRGRPALPAGAEHLGLSADDVPTFYALQFLLAALDEAGNRKNALHPFTLAVLHNRIASLCQKLGSAFLPQAQAHYQKAWQGYSGQGLHAARIALKLGDINYRLRQIDEAQHWWGTAIQLCEGASPTNVEPSLEPTDVPSAPWAQRIVASTLVSVSAFYAQTGNFAEAEKFEESSLSFLQSIPAPDSITRASPPQMLHALFLLQRSSLLSVHLAEVLHAQDKPLASSIQHLSLAAESSERVARALSDLPLCQTTGTIYDAPVPKGEDQISPVFSSSTILHPVARRLYHDAERTAAEAWNLLGVLYERHDGRTSKTALQCYKRAVQWAGETRTTESEFIVVP